MRHKASFWCVPVCVQLFLGLKFVIDLAVKTFEDSQVTHENKDAVFFALHVLVQTAP